MVVAPIACCQAGQETTHEPFRTMLMKFWSKSHSHHLGPVELQRCFKDAELCP